MSFKLTLDFASVEDRESFIGWFLDGGASISSTKRVRCMPSRTSAPAAQGGGDWEWGVGEEEKRAENYTIEMRPYADEEGDSK